MEAWRQAWRPPQGRGRICCPASGRRVCVCGGDASASSGVRVWGAAPPPSTRPWAFLWPHGCVLHGGFLRSPLLARRLRSRPRAHAAGGAHGGVSAAPARRAVPTLYGSSTALSGSHRFSHSEGWRLGPRQPRGIMLLTFTCPPPCFACMLPMPARLVVPRPGLPPAKTPPRRCTHFCDHIWGRCPNVSRAPAPARPLGKGCIFDPDPSMVERAAPWGSRSLGPHRVPNLH